MRKCFDFVGWLDCLSVNKITQNFVSLWINVHGFFGGVGLGTKNISLDFGATFSSRSRNIISSSPICNMYRNSVNLLLIARCKLYNADDFSDEPDFNIVYQFNIPSMLYVENGVLLAYMKQQH